MKRFLPLVPVTLFVVFAVAMFFGLRNDPSRIPSVLIDKPMPAFSLPPVRDDGRGFANADLAGHVSLVNVFGSWCGVCQEENPTLLQLSASKAARIYGVDWKDSPEDGAAWLKQHGDPFVLVGGDESGRFSLDLGVTGAPETFVVDKRGRIRYKQIGAITPEVWERKLRPLMAKLEAE